MSKSPDPNQQRINISDASVKGQVGQAGRDLIQTQYIDNSTRVGDKREVELEELLQSCIVRLSIAGKLAWSNGFFVAPDTILTDAQWLKTESRDEPVQVTWRNKTLTARISGRVENGDVNLALLELTTPVPNHPCVFLDKVVQADDRFYSYTYPDQSDQGVSIRGQCEGKPGENSAIIRFRTKPSSIGLNGAPLLNIRTGKVCGIVKQVSDQGAIVEGISAETILTSFSNLKSAQAKFHQKDRRWLSLLPLVRCKPRTVLLTSLGMTMLVVLIRAFQVFQPLELSFYDSLIRSRFSPPKPSDRFLIVKVTKQDAEAQEKRGEAMTYSLSNVTLAKLLQKVQTLKPTAIGLDIYREQVLNVQSAPVTQSAPPVRATSTPKVNQGIKPAPTAKLAPAARQKQSLKPTLPKPAPVVKPTPVIGQEQAARQTLSTLFQQPNLFAVCKVGDEKDPEGISPPPNVATNRVGFSDFSQDPDGILRRQLLAFHNDDQTHPRCPSSKSLGLLLAQHYLKTRANIETDVGAAEESCQIRFSNGVVLANLQANTGGYQGYSGNAKNLFNGCQILLNYREQKENQDYKTVGLEEFLSSSFPAKDYNNRIVMIGIDRSDGINDNWRTPYNQGPDQVTPGVLIQAQMIDQILDVAAKKQPLIWVLPGKVDLTLILVFALVGGGVSWWLISLRQLGIFVVASCGTMLIISIVVFQLNGWVPLMPHFLALSLTGSYVWWSNLRLKLDPKAK